MLSQIDVFHDCFDQVDDPRVSGRTTHPLNSILLLVVAATIVDADGPEEIQDFANCASVGLDTENEQIVIDVEHPRGTKFCCPQCEQELACYDHVPRPASVPKAVWINAPKVVSELKNEAPEANCLGAPEATSLTHPRSGYPSVSCVSAEPTSVSPDTSTINEQSTLNTRVMPEKISGFQGLAPDHPELSI